MTREELKAHCIRQIEQIEMWAKCKGEKPSGKVYEEHKLILELIEQQPRKGHWIEVLGGCKCSCCDMAFSRLKETCADNYCPNCGVDMRGEDKE